MSYAKAKQRYESDAAAAETESRTAAYRCAAQGCPMAGAFSEGSQTWWCAYHAACHPNDIARVTSVLHQHKDLRDIVREGRQLHAEHGNEASWPAEWKRMRDLLLFGGYSDPAPGAPTFHGWLYRVEAMLGGLVSESMGARRKGSASAEPAPSRTHAFADGDAS